MRRNPKPETVAVRRLVVDFFLMAALLLMTAGILKAGQYDGLWGMLICCTIWMFLFALDILNVRDVYRRLGRGEHRGAQSVA